MSKMQSNQNTESAIIEFLFYSFNMQCYDRTMDTFDQNKLRHCASDIKLISLELLIMHIYFILIDVWCLIPSYRFLSNLDVICLYMKYDIAVHHINWNVINCKKMTAAWIELHYLHLIFCNPKNGYRMDFWSRHVMT